MESTIWSVASTISEIREVTCRTTVSLAILEPTGDTELRQLRDARQLVADAFAPLLERSDSRLRAFQISLVGCLQPTTEEPSVINVMFAGPPPDETNVERP